MKLIICCLSIFFSTYTFLPAQLSEANYKIFSVKLNKEVGLDEIASDMSTYNVILFGEEHNDSVSHFLQVKLLEVLYARYNNKLALSLEMFDRDVQTVMNEYLLGFIREKNFRKDARVWSNYNDYRPMVEFCKEKRLDVVCANAPSRYTNLAGRKGQKALESLSKKAKKYIAPLPYDTATGPYLDKLNSFTSHSAPATKDTSVKTTTAPPPMMMGNFHFVTAQSLWDATMAYSIAKYFKKNKKKKILHVNGRFHSDEGLAIVTQLKKYNSKIKPLVLSSGSDENFPNIDWNQHKHLGHYIIITDPAVPKTFSSQ
jgi:uncharacterized iron-regulated protein